MSGTLFNAPRYTPVNSTGRPRAGAKMYFYRAGTSTPAAVYTTASLGTAHAVPVVASAAGEFPAIYLNPASGYDYKAVLQTSDGVQVWSEDNIPGTLPAESVGLALYPRTTEESAASVTPTNYQYPPGDVRRYGAVGNGVTDDTAACQAALDTGHDVVFPGTEYRISSPLKVGRQRVTGTGRSIEFAQTLINPTGNFAAFETDDELTSFEIDGFFIDYGDSVPTDSASSSGKIGFNFSAATYYPQFMAIRNCSVRGAWYGLYDDMGTYHSVLERVRMQKCRTGVYKQNGTTINFISCAASGGQQGFVCINSLAPTFLNCSADQLTVTASTPNTAGNYFSQTPGLVISGWDGESNNISGDGSAYMKFSTTFGSVSGFCGYINTLTGASTNKVSMFYLTSNSRVQFNGCRVPGLTSADLAFSGSAGYPYTLYADGNSKATVISSDFGAATGGSPTARSSVVGSTADILLVNSYVNETYSGTYNAGSAETWNCSALTSAGTVRIGTTSDAVTDNGFKLFTGGEAYLVSPAAKTTSIWNKSDYTAGTTYYCEFRAANTAKGSISSDGTNVAYNTSSDERLKESIADAGDSGSKVDGIKVRSFDWKAGGHVDFGTVAQELVTVAPEAVTRGEVWGVDYSKLVPLLVRELQLLRGRVAALES